jgi:hypothetical protein
MDSSWTTSGHWLALAVASPLQPLSPTHAWLTQKTTRKKMPSRLYMGTQRQHSTRNQSPSQTPCQDHGHLPQPVTHGQALTEEAPQGKLPPHMAPRHLRYLRIPTLPARLTPGETKTKPMGNAHRHSLLIWEAHSPRVPPPWTTRPPYQLQAKRTQPLATQRHPSTPTGSPTLRTRQNLTPTVTKAIQTQWTQRTPPTDRQGTLAYRASNNPRSPRRHCPSPLSNL